jgi:hypothetical protein
MPLQIVVLSDNSEDHALGKKVSDVLSRKARVDLQFCSSNNSLRNLLTANPQTIVLWNIESDDRDIIDTAQVLSQFLPPERVFALSSKQIGTHSPLAKSSVFGHFFLRREDPVLPEIVGRLALACSSSRLDEIITAVLDGGSAKKIELEKTVQRKPAIEAIQKVLEKREVSDRICKKVAKATDELLMNAFFRAPRNEAGQAYRFNHSKLEDIELQGNEKVELEFVTHPAFFGVSVRDQFGSLERKDVQQQFNRGYQSREYSTTQGLGVYQTFHGGLSLMFLVKPKKETRAWIFVPLSHSYKQFQQSFRFFSFIFEK